MFIGILFYPKQLKAEMGKGGSRSLVPIHRAGYGGLPALMKATKVACHTPFFKVDGLAAFRASLSKEAVTVSVLLIGSVLLVSFF